MKVVKDYGQGFVRLNYDTHFFFRINGRESVTEELAEAFKVHRCVQHYYGQVILNERDSTAVKAMSVDDFRFCLDDFAPVPKVVQEFAGFIVIKPCKEFTVGQIQELMEGVKRFFTENDVLAGSGSAK